jgi:hypothetical protein
VQRLELRVAVFTGTIMAHALWPLPQSEDGGPWTLDASLAYLTAAGFRAPVCQDGFRRSSSNVAPAWRKMGGAPKCTGPGWLA